MEGRINVSQHIFWKTLSTGDSRSMRNFEIPSKTECTPNISS
jgi:hypothetical protein